MPDLPEEAVQAAAEVLYRHYDSEYGADHLSWRDFTEAAREVLEAAAPVLAAQAVAEEREAVAAYLRRAHKGHGLMKLEAFGRKLAAVVEAGYHIEPECACETLHYHCYASGCPCKRHEREVGGA